MESVEKVRRFFHPSHRKRQKALRAAIIVFMMRMNDFNIVYYFITIPGDGWTSFEPFSIRIVRIIRIIRIFRRQQKTPYFLENTEFQAL